MGDKRTSTLRATLAASLVVLISKAGGFIREVVMAAYFGTGNQLDAYNAAYGLYYVPVLLLSSCITSALTPTYITERRLGEKRAERFGSNIILIVAALSAIISALLYVCATPLVRLVYGGFDEETTAMTVRYLRIMLPSLAFIMTSVSLSTILNARERFSAAQLTGFPITVTLMTATIGFSARFGATALAWGIFASGILQVLILLPFMRPVFKFRLWFRPRDRAVRSLALLAAPAMLSMAVNELNHLIDRSLASGLAGGAISGMNFAYKLIVFIMGVLLIPLTTVVFSKMSERAAAGDKGALKELAGRSVDMAALLTLPIIAVGCVLASDIVRFAYMRGEFNADSAAITSSAFFYYLLGLFGFGLRDILNRAFHAQRDTRTPMINACGTVALNIVLNLILVGPMGAGGLALATSISASVGALALYALLRRKVGHMHGRLRVVQLVKIAASALLAALTAFTFDFALPEAGGTLTLLLRLALIAVSAMIVYIGAALASGVNQARELIDILERRLKRR